jgi:hypothetical protein
MPEFYKVKQMLPAGWGGAGMGQLRFSMRAVSYSSMATMSDKVSSPALIRGRGLQLSQPQSLETSAMEDYDVPVFLRRQGEPAPTVNIVGQPITIKADRIWFKLNDAQEKTLALLTPNPQATGSRIWFINEKHEVFDFMDFMSLEDAVNALQLNGFSDYVKKKFSLLNRVRTRYTWKCEDHTRVFTNSVTWIKT